MLGTREAKVEYQRVLVSMNYRIIPVFMYVTTDISTSQPSRIMMIARIDAKENLPHQGKH